MKLGLVLALLVGWLPQAVLACGATSDCKVETGAYRIFLPADAPSPRGAIVFAHGYQGSAAGTMKSKGLRQMATDRGLALIALDALGDDWNVPNAPHESSKPRDEMEYLDEVVADAVARFKIDRESVVIGGFSAGGMYVWNVICARGDAFAGYIPYSGTFWKEAPSRCPARAQNVVHVHGNADQTVPLAGRAIGATRQGDVGEALAMYRDNKGFKDMPAYEVAGMRCSHSGNSAGKRLDFCLFDGDHDFSGRRFGAAYDALMQ